MAGELFAAVLTEMANARRAPQGGRAQRLWPAAICYAVTAATQSRERPTGHSPWDPLGDGFEEGTLAGHFDQIGNTLDTGSPGPVFTLSIGVPLITEALGLNPSP